MTGWIIAGAVVLLLVFLLASSAVIEIEYRDKLSVKIKYLLFTVKRFPESSEKLRKKKQKERRKEEKELAKKRKALLKKQKKQGKEPDKALAEAASLARELQMGAGEQPQEEEQQDIGAQDSDKIKAENNTDSAKKHDKKPKKKKQDLGELFGQLKLFVSSAKKPLLKLIKSIRINVHDLKITAGGEDAAKAALNYGKINMLVGNAIGWLDSIMTLKIRDMDVGIDFQKEETVYSGKGTVKIRLFTAIVCGLAFFINMTKNTLNSDKNGGIKNGRTSNSRAHEHGNAKNKRAG